MFKKMLILDESEEGVVSVFKKFNIKDCCYLLGAVWKCRTQVNLSRAWKKLLMAKEKEKGKDDLEVDQSAVSFTSILQEIPAFQMVLLKM